MMLKTRNKKPPSGGNIHVHVHFVLCLLPPARHARPPKDVHTKKQHGLLHQPPIPDRSQSGISMDFVDPFPGVILGDTVVPCGRLIQYYSRTLHALAPSTRTWLLRNHLKTFHHENRSCSTAWVLWSTALWQTVLDLAISLFYDVTR